jgi:hypothetical protein
VAGVPPRRVRRAVFARARRGEAAGRLPLHGDPRRACPRCRSGASGSGTGLVRYDAGLVLSIIADQGYSYTPGAQSPVAFFPGYPLMVRALSGVFDNVQLGRHRADRGVRGRPRSSPSTCGAATGSTRRRPPPPCCASRSTPTRPTTSTAPCTATRCSCLCVLLAFLASSATHCCWPGLGRRRPHRHPAGGAWRWSSALVVGVLERRRAVTWEKDDRPRLHLRRAARGRRVGAAVGLGALVGLVAVPVGPASADPLAVSPPCRRAGASSPARAPG